MRKRRIGKIIMKQGICLALICGGSFTAYAQEEAAPLQEEEIIIENDAGFYEVKPEEEAADMAVDSMESLTESEETEQISEPSDTEQIQMAIDAGTEVTITINEDMILESTIYIPGGKRVALVPAEGKEVTMFRGEQLFEPFFYVEKEATLILGYEGPTEGTLILNHGDDPTAAEGIVKGDGEIIQLDGVLSDSSEGIIIDDSGDMGLVTVDLKDADIEILNGENLVYNGMPQTPDVLVWVGSQMLMKGFDYDVAYSNNIDAGLAEITVTATGIGTCTGTAETLFQILPAVPQYSISDQKAEMGIQLSQLIVPTEAVGVNGETVKGTLLWSDSEGGQALPMDMTLSGAAGESMTLFWTFYPEEANTNYLPAAGSMKITFEMPSLPDDGSLGNTDIWGDMSVNVGDLSSGSSSSGTTNGEDISVNISGNDSYNEGDGNLPDADTEPYTEPETEISTETETEASAGGYTEISNEEHTESDTEMSSEEHTESDTEMSSEEHTESNEEEYTEPDKKGNTEKSLIKNAESKTVGSSSISVSSGASVSKKNPETGDTKPFLMWSVIWAVSAMVLAMESRNRCKD